MTNLEFYKDELINILIENMGVDKDGKPHRCDGFCSDECIFQKDGDCLMMAKEWLLEEHKEPIKLKRWEYDILQSLIHYAVNPPTRFNHTNVLLQLVDKGYFKGVAEDRNKIKNSVIKDVLDNCEIVSDDYDGFEECK